MFWNKIDNLYKLKEKWINIPKFLYYKWGEPISFKEVKEKLNLPLILRSSFDLEDWEYSFAWIFNSYFPIYNEKDFYKNINKILDYKNDKLFKNYINRNKISIDKFCINILVQEFIVWDYSWVIFTDNKNINIEFIPGLNYMLLSWKTDSSCRIKVNKYNRNYEIKSIFLDYYFSTIKNKKLTKKFIDFDFDYTEFFINNYLEKLYNIVFEIEKINWENELDIEFTIKGSEIYILQSRKNYLIK